jgi:hypothetical protein
MGQGEIDMNPNNRITYRFDRAGNAISEQNQGSEAKPESAVKMSKEKVVPLYPAYEQHSVNEQSPWNSPFQDDIAALEKLIRETEQEATKPVRPSSSKAFKSEKSAKPGQAAASSLHPDTLQSDEFEEHSHKMQSGKQINEVQERSRKIQTDRQFNEFEERSRKIQSGKQINELDDLPASSGRIEDALEAAAYDGRGRVRQPAAASGEAGADTDWPGQASAYREPEFEPDRPFADYEEEKPQRRIARTNRTQGPSWVNVFLSVAAALATGALFGYFLLSLFTGASLWPIGASQKEGALPATGSISDSATDPNTANNGNKAGGAGAAENPAVAPAKTVALSGLDQTYYMLQFGVFNTPEGRDTALAQLAAKGLAAATLAGADNYRVYAGVAVDKSNAETVQAQLGDIELYIKAVTIETPDHIAYNGPAEEAQSFFADTKELVYMLDELTLTQLEQPSLSPLGEAAAQAWQTKYAEWTKKAEALRIGITDEQGKAYAAKLAESVQGAAKALQDYDQKLSKAQLWIVQTSLMESILIQKEWFDSISAL